MIWDQRIPVRDGLSLSAILYLPHAHDAPGPAIVTLTPYTAQSCHETAMFFASHGYPFLSVDVRGRGGSDGQFHPRNEAADGHDVVEWIATQPYCNGRVAMWGGSYGGYAQWATASQRPAHLASMAPAASPYRGVDSPLRNNIFAPGSLQWLTLLAGTAAQDRIYGDQAFWAAGFLRAIRSGRPFRELDSLLLGAPHPLFQEWLQHPQVDAYWDSYNPSAEALETLTVPILTITGAYDANQQGAIAHYRAHQVHASAAAGQRHFLVIGPWDHAGTRAPKPAFGGLDVGAASLVDLGRLHLEWYAWTMGGGPRPDFLKARVTYYVTGADIWRHADTLDEIPQGTCSLYLASVANPTDVYGSGALQPEPPASTAPDHYVYDPRDLAVCELEAQLDPGSLVDQRLIHAASGTVLVYHSPRFEDSVVVAGFLRLSLWMSIDQPDTDFQVSVHEIDEGGGSLLLAADTLRARYREDPRRAARISTQEPRLYEFTRFPFVARQVARGRRLRLVVGPLRSIYAQRNHNTGGEVSDETLADARPVRVQVFHDAARPSALHLPLSA